MNKTFAGLTAAVLAAGVLGTSALAATAKMAPKGKMVSMYKAEKCGMIFTAAQYKQFKGACPASHGKMHKVMLTPAAAKTGMAATTKELPAEKAGMKKAM